MGEGMMVHGNGLTNHLGRDVYRGLLMHAGLLLLLFVVVVVVAPQGGHFGQIVLRHTASLFCHHFFCEYRYGALVWSSWHQISCRYYEHPEARFALFSCFSFLFSKHIDFW